MSTATDRKVKTTPAAAQERREPSWQAQTVRQCLTRIRTDSRRHELLQAQILDDVPPHLERLAPVVEVCGGDEEVR
jgi:hypothetical protein